MAGVDNVFKETSDHFVLPDNLCFGRQFNGKCAAFTLPLGTHLVMCRSVWKNIPGMNGAKFVILLESPH